MQEQIAGKADSSHTHDDRYYTETEVNNNFYKTNDSAVTSIASDDYIPFYDTSANAKKRIHLSDMVSNAVTIGSTGTASASATRYQRIGINGTYTTIDGTMYMEISNTSSTTYTFKNSAITTAKLVDVYTNTYGDNPSKVTVSAGNCTVTFSAAKSRSVRIYIR